ncbi:MAG TPA: YigZ family protein, partial [Rhodothermales bacterium]|nr:YigZ family protein [Rhodothermales bacterium]
MDSDRYPTLAASPAPVEPPKTKGSRFIGDAFPARSEAEVAACLERVRRREHTATHHCWAARLGVPGPTGYGARPRYSDDGEPGGSAGLPILREIDRRGLSDVLVVVTRYYGGTKLGTGGLARAY